MLTQKLRIAAIAVAAGGLTLAVPASAVPAAHAANWATAPAAYGDLTSAYDRDDRRRWNRGRDHRSGRYDRYDRRDRRYDNYRNNNSVWRGNDGRYYCRKSDGTTGLIIGGAAGALLGREVAGRNGDRTLGAILGAAGGALLGKSLDSGTRCN